MPYDPKYYAAIKADPVRYAALLARQRELERARAMDPEKLKHDRLIQREWRYRTKFKKIRNNPEGEYPLATRNP